MASYDILQWNCKGLRSRAEHLKVLLREANPGVVCLQEIQLGLEKFNPGLDYEIFTCTPPVGDRAHGGAAIIINKSLECTPLALNTDLQAVALKIALDREITVCSLYLPPRFNFLYSDIQSLVDELPQPYMILGDFNAHNPLWGGDTLDNAGKIIEDILNNNDSVLLNDGSMTYHNIYFNTYSAIDLSICSSEIGLNFIWSVDEFLNSSDHFPIHLKFARNVPTEMPQKWKPLEADWEKYKEGIKLDLPFESFDDPLKVYDYWAGKTLVSAEAAIPKTSGIPRRPTVFWWDKKCSTLRKVTRRCYKKYKASGTTTAKKIYQRVMAKQRRYFRQAKRNSWIYYINGINSKTPSRVVWKKVRKLAGKFVPSKNPSLKMGDDLITNLSEMANSLGRHFSSVSSASNYSAEFQRIRNTQVDLNLSGGNSEHYNARFSLKELNEALLSTSDTSPGEDTILNVMLRKLPDEAKRYLLKIINKIWETGILPQSWKIAIVIPIKKPNKDPYQTTSYRPIALTSCVCKVMEKMINSRLVWHLETKKLLSPFQFGFRKNRSTLDPLLRLSNQIQQGFVQNCQTIGVFFDMEKAYDTTWRNGILKQLQKMGIKGNLIRFIHSFLSNRFIKVRVGNVLSNAFKQEEGVPQGSVLSVTLFAVAINGILDEVPNPVRASLFVDDLAIYCTAYDAISACRYVQKAINAVSKWAKMNGFKFSAIKTVAIRFTRCRRKEVIPNLKLDDMILPFADDVKFLGMTFDSKLTWAKHIDILQCKVKKTLNLLKVVSGFEWGADKKSLLRLYDALCRSKLDYGCQIYSSACNSKLNDLNVAHNMGLRICSGAYRTSPIESLYVDTHQLPLDLRREELGLRYQKRIESNTENPSNKILHQQDDSKFKPRSSVPFQIRLNQTTNDRSLISQKILELAPPIVPPWLIPRAEICEKYITKKDSNDEMLRKSFLEHDETHEGAFKIYTDGSKSTEGVGLAVVTDNSCDVAKLPNYASIYTAELCAINRALTLVHYSSRRKFVIYSDSKSALESLNSYNSSHPLVLKAQEWLFRISCRHKHVSFCWVPAHVGIKGNERADREAKKVCSKRNLDVLEVPYCDIKSPIRKYIRSKWQERWSSLADNKKLKTIRPLVNYWQSSFHKNRRTEIVLTRLRIGHSRLTHSFILNGSEAPRCARCNSIVSVEHILVLCPLNNVARQKYGFLDKQLSQILGNDVDIDNLVGFLKEIDVYSDI